MTIHYRLPDYPTAVASISFARIPVLRRRKLEKYYSCYRKEVDSKMEARTMQNVGTARFLASQNRSDGNRNLVLQNWTMERIIHVPILITGLKLSQPRKAKNHSNLKDIDCSKTYPEVCRTIRTSETNQQQHMVQSETVAKESKQEINEKEGGKLTSSNDESKTKETCPMRNVQSVSKTENNCEVTNTNEDTVGSLGTQKEYSSSSLINPRAKCSISSTEQRFKKTVPKKQILRLSSGKRRILVGVTLPAVNEKNYLACPAIQEKKIKDSTTNVSTTPLPGIMPPPSTPSNLDNLTPDFKQASQCMLDNTRRLRARKLRHNRAMIVTFHSQKATIKSLN